MAINLKKTAQISKALAEPIRLRILTLLENKSLCVMDIVTILELPQPTISRHLAYLQKSGLIHSNQKGLWRFYTLTQDTYSNLIQPFLEAARSAPELREDLKAAAALARKGGCCPKS